MKIRVEIEKIVRQGTNKANRAYFIQSAYVSLPGFKFPQYVEFYTETVLNPGTYDVPVECSVKDNKPAFELDYSAAQPVQKAA